MERLNKYIVAMLQERSDRGDEFGDEMAEGESQFGEKAEWKGRKYSV